MALGKNSKNSDIDSLKARFSQMQQPAQAQQQAQPVQQPVQQVPVQQQAQPAQAQQQAQPVQQPVQQVAPQPTPNTAQDQGRPPLEALWQMNQAQQSSQQVNVIELEGQQDQLVAQNIVDPQAAASQQVQIPQEDEVVEESLVNLKDKYDDAKLNSIIIDQVKELIEIDNNLNSKIEDMKSDLRKEVEERQKLAKINEERYGELKELEKSIEKFIALYEVVTNQFNPFVKQDDPQGQADFNRLVQGAPQKTPTQQQDASVHFVTGKGQRIRNLAELMSWVAAMPEHDFSKHVGPYKNDFATWIHHGLHMPKLAEVVSKQNDKQAVLQILVDYKKYR